MAKIALVSNTDWYLYNFRLSLANFLREAGQEVSLISPPGEYAERLQQAGFAWHAWQVGRQTLAPWLELSSLRQLKRLYHQLKPDLVHHHTIKPVLYGGLAARSAGIPAAVQSITGRGYVFLGQDARSRLLRQIVRPFYRLILNRPASHTIFENDGDRQYFIQQKLARPDQTHLIESVGVDPDHFAPVPEPQGDPVILLASRLLWDKGIGVLVDATRLLRQKTQARVVLAGLPDPGNPTSIPETQLHAWVQEGLVEWWGWQTDMQAAYTRCNIVVLPSFHEGVPTGLLEAAACGRAIVASDIPGCRTIVVDGETGLLVPPGQAEPLAEALARLALDADLRGRMGAAGRQRVLDKFTQQHINQQTYEVYQEALAQAGI